MLLGKGPILGIDLIPLVESAETFKLYLPKIRVGIFNMQRTFRYTQQKGEKKKERYKRKR